MEFLRWLLLFIPAEDVEDSFLNIPKNIAIEQFVQHPNVKKIFNNDELNFPHTSSADIYKEIPSFENKNN